MPFRIRIFLSILLALLGLLLLGPLLLPVPPLEGTAPAETLAAEGAFVTVDGVKLHYRSAGSGDNAFLLIHGYPSNLATWRKIAPELSLYGRVVSYDRPGFGYSERPDRGSGPENPYRAEQQVEQALALLDELDIDSAVWVGSSSGALLALEAALAHPERVEGLILLSPTVYSDRSPPAWTRPLLSTPQLSRLGPLLMRQLGGQPGVSLYRSQWADPQRIDEQDINAFRRTFEVEGWDRGLWQVSRASRPFDLAGRESNLQAPTLVAAGARDVIVPPEESERLARELPDATFALLEDCGHLPQEECPSMLLQVLIEWLRGADGQGDTARGTDSPGATLDG